MSVIGHGTGAPPRGNPTITSFLRIDLSRNLEIITPGHVRTNLPNYIEKYKKIPLYYY